MEKVLGIGGFFFAAKDKVALAQWYETHLGIPKGPSTYDVIKIDRKFVQDAEYNNSTLEICRAIVGLGHSLKKAVVAEGVETETQLSMLQDIGCDFVQGYYFFTQCQLRS